MRRFQDARRLYVSIRLARKHDNLVSRVRLYRIDVTILRVNVNPVVILDVGLRPLNDPLRLRERNARRRIVEPVEYPKSPVVVVHEDNFIKIQIHRNRAVNRIHVPDRACRRTSYNTRLAGFLRTGIYRCFTKPVEQTRLFRQRFVAGLAHVCGRR